MIKSNRHIKHNPSFLLIIDKRISRFVKPLNPFLNKLVEPLDPLLAKLAIYLLLFSSIILTILTTWNLYDRYIMVHKLILVAGNKKGESFQISQALAKVVNTHSHGRIDIQVVETDGTDENLEALEGRLDNAEKVNSQTKQSIQQMGAKHADLATAQADVVADTVALSSANSANTVATLYPDVFQIVIRGALVTDNPPQVSSLQGKKIEVPAKGGQRTSFLAIAEHYGWRENKDFSFLTDLSPEEAFCAHRIDAVFRVRTLANREIANMLNCGGKLVQINQGDAMKIQHPAFQSQAIIPQGAYKGDIPVPSANLSTVSVERLLLARSDVSERIIREITAILCEHRSEIGENIQYKEVKPLVTYISTPNPNSSTGISLHPGASNYYKGNKSTFLQEHRNIVSLLFSVISFIASILWKINVGLKKKRKDQADEYIKEVVALMKSETNLNELFESQRKLEQTFYQASKDLRNEKISQESFRTFNEAYKTSREFIERTIQEKQRLVSAYLVKQIMSLLDKQGSGEEILQELDRQLIEARRILTQQQAFSRESFRTFVEAYNVVRMTLNDRRKH